MKLDSQLIKALGARSAPIDDLRMYGLTGRQVLQSSGSFEADLSEHEKGKRNRYQVKVYKKNQVQNGIAVSSRVLKVKTYSTGVYYPVDEPIEREAGKTGLPGEEYVTLSPERWDGNRVNMHGTQTSRTNNGFRGKKPRKGWKRYESK